MVCAQRKVRLCLLENQCLVAEADVVYYDPKTDSYSKTPFPQKQGYEGSFDQGSYNQGGYNQSSFNQGNYNQGNFGQGDYNQGGFNQGSYNPNPNQNQKHGLDLTGVRFTEPNQNKQF